jgi:hypothetical protein
MEDLWNRLQREIKANAKKAALLGVLLLVGCCIWVPMALRAVFPTRPAVAKIAPALPTSVPTPTSGPSAEQNPNPSELWKKLTLALAEDSSFRSGDIQSMTRSPFQILDVPEPLPVLFAAEPVPQFAPKTDADPVKLELGSTIIGRNRRAALINGQLYHVGRSIQAEGEQYLLTQVESNRVVLTSGHKTIELTLTRPQLKDVLNRMESPAQPVQ